MEVGNTIKEADFTIQEDVYNRSVLTINNYCNPWMIIRTANGLAIPLDSLFTGTFKGNCRLKTSNQIKKLAEWK